MNHRPGTRVGERSIRVFIASTFRDMHAEHDVLNRVVFPELRKRCQQRGADFIGVDLRWGVTEEEAQGAGALAVCLDEIERCRPFFVCLPGGPFRLGATARGGSRTALRRRARV